MPEPDPAATIQTPPGATPASAGSPGESPPFPVPDHTLIRRIGRGAYGEVWLAHNALGTWRAVKFVRRCSFDDDKPFEREFAGIQRFEPISRSHESQLNILHVGRGEDGFFYVMELADDMGRGQDIDEATYTPRNLRSELHLRGRLPAAECLRIGLVARAEATASFVGTEGFLPPEGPGTRQADIYSLGKVLYEISTGHDRNQFPELPTNIVELPDRADLSELNEVLLKACHRDPKERYQTAAEMHAELALLESGRSVVRLRGIERRLQFVQRAGAIVTIIAALATGFYFWQARQTRIVRDLAAENSRLLSLEAAAHKQASEAEREAVQERDGARRSEQNSEHVLRFLLRRVVAAARPPDEDGEGRGRDISVLQALQAAEPTIPDAFAGQPRAELELRTSLADTLGLLGLATNAVTHRQRALELSEALFGPGSPEVLTNRMELGWALRDAGLTNEYLAQFQTAWLTASNALGAADERTLSVLGWLGAAYREVGRTADSVRVLESAVQTGRETLGNDDPRTSILQGHLGWSYYHSGQYEHAIPLLEQVLAGRKRTLGREHYHTTGVMIDLARAYLAAGREREAFSLMEEAYEIRRQTHGQQHSLTLMAIDALARACERASRTNDALSWHTLALRLREAKLGPDQASTVRTRADVLRLRAALGALTNEPAR